MDRRKDWFINSTPWSTTTLSVPLIGEDDLIGNDKNNKKCRLNKLQNQTLEKNICVVVGVRHVIWWQYPVSIMNVSRSTIERLQCSLRPCVCINKRSSKKSSLYITIKISFFKNEKKPYRLFNIIRILPSKELQPANWELLLHLKSWQFCITFQMNSMTEIVNCDEQSDMGAKEQLSQAPGTEVIHAEVAW